MNHWRVMHVGLTSGASQLDILLSVFFAGGFVFAKCAHDFVCSWFGHVEGALVQPVAPAAAASTARSDTKVILRWLNAACAYSGPLTVFMGHNRTFPSGCQGGAKLLGASYSLLSETSVGDHGGRLFWSGLELFPSLPPAPQPPAPPTDPPALGFCPSSNFSACESAVRGDYLGDYSPNHEHVELHIATSAVTRVDALYLDMQGVNPKPINPDCNPHQQAVTVRGVIYSDVGGRPSKLVASTVAVTLDKNAARSFVKLKLLNGKAVTLPAGKYWLGNHIGSICAVMWGSPASANRNPCVYGQQLFADGPAPTFPTSNVGRCSGALSVFATFQGAAAAVFPAEPTEEQAEAAGSLAGNSTALTSWIFSLLLTRDTRSKTDDVSPFHQPSRPVSDSGGTRSGPHASPPAARNASNECGVSVRDFGAIGDGVHDDTGPIQAALNSGESVYIPQGTYMVTSALLLNTTRQTVRGAGQQSVLLTTTDIETMYTNSQVAQITLADLRFLNTVPENITGPTHFQVHFGPATSSTDIRDCDFRTALTGQVVRTTHHAGVWFEGANLNNIWDCTFNQAHILMGSTDSTIRGGFVYSFSFQYAIQIASAGEVVVDAVRGILGGPDKGCIWIPKPSYINKIVNSYFGGSYKFMNTGNGITADQPEMLQVIGNTFQEIDGVGVHLTTPCRGNVISGNSFWAGNAKQNDSTGLIAGKQDIYIESLLFGASGTNIIGNVFNRFLGPVEDGMPGIGKSHAIEFNLKAGTAGNIVTGNSIVGARYFAPAIVDPNINDAVNNNIGSAFSGSWTPSDLSGANLGFTDVTCKYTRTPDLVTVWVSFTFPPTSSNALALIGGLPFAPQPGMAGAAGSLTTDSPVVQKVELVPEKKHFVMTDVTGAQQSNAACSGKRFSFSASYLSGP